MSEVVLPQLTPQPPDRPESSCQSDGLTSPNYAADKQGPMGSFFDTIPNTEAAKQLENPRSKEQRQLLEKEGPELIMAALTITGMLPQKPEDNNITDTAELHRRHRSVAREIIKETADYYQATYWQNFNERTGLDIDRLGELHDRAEHAPTAPIHQLLEQIASHNRSNEHIADALRIVKLILVNESEEENQDLP